MNEKTIAIIVGDEVMLITGETSKIDLLSEQLAIQCGGASAIDPGEMTLELEGKVLLSKVDFDTFDMPVHESLPLHIRQATKERRMRRWQSAKPTVNPKGFHKRHHHRRNH